MPDANKIVVIEFYDSGVRISDDKNILADSISCALIESDKSIVVGEQTEHQAHLRPRESSTLFWGNLAESSDTKHSISNAEIALHHLEHVWNSASLANHDAILVTPVTLDKQALGLLLGICKKLSINVAGIVCNATLAMQQMAEGCQAIYLDLLQQQLAITEIKQSTNGLSLKQPSHILNFGLSNFIQNYAKSIAKKFIDETRFDPLHTAHDEQQFFDKLPLWLSTLSEKSSIECKLGSGEKQFTIQIDNEYLQTADNKLFKEIAAHLNLLLHKHELVAIYCSSTCNQVYGLQNFLSNLPGCAIIQLDKSDISTQALACRHEIISGEQVHYVNALAWHNQSDTGRLDFSTGRLSNLASIPTHILVRGHAYNLHKGLFLENSDVNNEPRILLENTPNCVCEIITNKLSVEIQALNNQSISLNQHLIESISPVNIGDILNIRGSEISFQFIKVANNET